MQTFENEVDELVTVSTSDGQQVTATPGHKFYANNDWVSAEDLRAGDVLVNVNGKRVIVEQVQHEILDSPVKVYNFEVADNHTYFVGDGDGMAVHNSACSKKDVGAYEFKVKLEDGTEHIYVGKGTLARRDVSIKNKVKEFKGTLVEGSEKFYPCTDKFDAFIKEAELMSKHLKDGEKLLNKIASPGFKYGNIPFAESFRDLLARKWFKP